LSVSQDENGIALNVCILEGAYRGGHFSFLLDIPINYPFKKVDVWAKHPIWHPNVELLTGRVYLPLDWSPVLTLNSLALAVQVNDYRLSSLYFNYIPNCNTPFDF
jgi:ubiquitin-protein ligase